MAAGQIQVCFLAVSDDVLCTAGVALWLCQSECQKMCLP